MQLSGVDGRAATALTTPVALMHDRSVWCSIEPWPRSAALEQAMPLYHAGDAGIGTGLPVPNLRAADGCTDGTREGRPRGEQRAVFSTLQRLKRKGTVTLTIVYGAAAASNSERQEPQELLSAHG
jgi:hypothetical protein